MLYRQNSKSCFLSAKALSLVIIIGFLITSSDIALADRFTLQQKIAVKDGEASIKTIGRYSFINTDKGIIKGQGKINSSTRWNLILAEEGISNLYSEGRDLYALKIVPKESENDRAHDHSIQVSRNFGASFASADEGLERCSSYEGTTWCGFVGVSQVDVVRDIIVSNAGGGDTIAISKDGGRTYSSLSGYPVDHSLCYNATFGVVGNNKILVGGECPLDMAFLQLCAVDDSFSSYQSCESKAPQDFGNRKVNAIFNIDGTSIILAGGEGNILRSLDGGETFQKVLWDLSNAPKPKYRYIEGFHYNPRQNILFAWGFDKAEYPTKPVLLISKNRGVTWRDLSHRLSRLSPYLGQITSVQTYRNNEIYLSGMAYLENRAFEVHLLQFRQ